MMNKTWTILLATLLGIVLCVSPYVNKYGILGWISFGIIVLVIPYAFYKALPNTQLSLLLALSTPVPLGFAWGCWLDFYENHRLKIEGIKTKAVVTATWTNRTRHNGKEKLFKVRFRTKSDYREIFSHINEKNYQAGDSVSVIYLYSEPNTYRLVE